MNQTNAPAQNKEKRKNKGPAFLGLILLLLLIGGAAYWHWSMNALRAHFTTRIVEMEPVDKIVAVKKIKDGRITFFSEIVGQNGKTILHVWKNGDKTVYTHKFKITSDKWRANSDVSLVHFNKGDKATVEIQDANGKILGSRTITVE